MIVCKMVRKQAHVHLANSGVLDLCMVMSKTRQVDIASRYGIKNYGYTGKGFMLQCDRSSCYT